MGLTAQLSSSLDVSSLRTTLTGGLSTHLNQLQGVNVGVDQGQVGQITSSTGQFNLGAVSSTISQVAGSIAPLVASLPVGRDIVAPIESALHLVETVGGQSLADRF